MPGVLAMNGMLLLQVTTTTAVYLSDQFSSGSFCIFLSD
jgi:hypothetical protein